MLHISFGTKTFAPQKLSHTRCFSSSKAVHFLLVDLHHFSPFLIIQRGLDLNCWGSHVRQNERKVDVAQSRRLTVSKNVINLQPRTEKHQVLSTPIPIWKRHTNTVPRVVTEIHRI